MAGLLLRKSLTSSSIEGNLKRNIPKEDVDEPFESGVVRVFKQPGIECPCDEDDYIHEDDVQQISTSVFVTNFPDQFSAKDLWNTWKQYG
ncbi:hypothetical protein Tco_0069989, partial [Tanacetum coccineum]